jgi:hypothetical protein
MTIAVLKLALSLMPRTRTMVSVAVTRIAGRSRTAPVETNRPRPGS